MIALRMKAIFPDGYMSYMHRDGLLAPPAVRIVRVPFHLQVRWYHVKNLKSAMARIFISQNSANAANQVFV